MRCTVFIVHLYLLASSLFLSATAASMLGALSTSVSHPTATFKPPIATLTPRPTAPPTELGHSPRQVQSFSTRIAFHQYEQTALDVPRFRKRMYCDHLSIKENYANAREVAMSFVKRAIHRVAAFLYSLDHVTVGNIVLRAAVRSLTPGFEIGLIESIAWLRIIDDVAASVYATETVLQLPAAPSDDAYDYDLILPSRLPTPEEVQYGIKWTLAHTDVSSLISLGLRVVVAYFDPAGTVDTSDAIALIDNFLHVVFRSHQAAFHVLGKVIQSIDTAFPSLELPPLIAELPQLLALDPAEPIDDIDDTFRIKRRRRVRYTRPILVDPEPTDFEGSFTTSLIPEQTESTSSIEHAGRRSPRELSGYAIGDDSNDSLIFDLVLIVVSLSAGGGIALAVGKKMFGTHCKAEHVRQDIIQLQLLKSLSYLSWQRRVEVMKKLATIKPRCVMLKPEYKLAINPGQPEQYITTHILRLGRALLPEKRKELVQILGLATPPPPPSPSPEHNSHPDDGHNADDDNNAQTPPPPLPLTPPSPAATVAPPSPPVPHPPPAPPTPEMVMM
ncbi:hypothetical protein H0H87_001820 [Tephrocybe sp. NHM501043]|nr:hypothetical protein H0H87_001820 [Tephrocybe sp. NHM501043]